MIAVLFAQADVAQSVVRRIGSAEVTGSIPVISFNLHISHTEASLVTRKFFV